MELENKAIQEALDLFHGKVGKYHSPDNSGVNEDINVIPEDE